MSYDLKVLHDNLFAVINCDFVHVTERRQTMLFSATATKKVEEITKLALKKEPMYIGVDDSKDAATVEGLEQGDL